jgi:molybdate transport system regulatory protein
MTRATRPRIESQLSIRPAGGAAPFRQRWMDLLASLEQQASITAAARAVGLSYKAAWDAIATMNNLSGELLVERNVGGKGGGGAQLTRRGRELVETFRTVQAESERFVERVNRRVKRSQDLSALDRLGLITSARNHFAGTVARITRGAVNDEVEVLLPGGAVIVATITRRSTQTLGLKKGGAVVALIKASWILLVADAGQTLKLSARNALRGRVTRLEAGAVNTEVSLELPGGQTVVALVTRASVQALGLAKGATATAVFKASSVILGVPG